MNRKTLRGPERPQQSPSDAHPGTHQRQPQLIVPRGSGAIPLAQLTLTARWRGPGKTRDLVPPCLLEGQEGQILAARPRSVNLAHHSVPSVGEQHIDLGVYTDKNRQCYFSHLTASYTVPVVPVVNVLLPYGHVNGLSRIATVVPLMGPKIPSRLRDRYCLLHVRL